ncbi:hypothetical protein MPDQ_002639 [Monascus purpureus]|uniref:BZIP domain-containing protein n=1 Tax=Monascus purpureus TaxID=5098 RepID=A0A507QMS5_MONPU|nr:hypothetical protein MPDQ_002639 [Monascus purpureus]BDD61194.1 hypothetical protein MAP00_006264 [Monascus purpureus]
MDRSQTLLSAVPRGTWSQSTSSAFSPHANPDEDWTQISDLAERRRIQNRIAQRNYRKKLKRRLEDLERKAGSDAAFSNAQEQSQPSKKTPKTKTTTATSTSTSTRSRTKQQQQQQRSPSARQRAHDLSSPSPYDPYPPSMFSQQCTRQLSTSPPPVFAYPPSSYPPLDGYLQPVYTPVVPVTPHHYIPNSYNDFAWNASEHQHFVSVLPPSSSSSSSSSSLMVPGGLPPDSMKGHTHDGSLHHPGHGLFPHENTTEDAFGPFSIEYPPIPSLDWHSSSSSSPSSSSSSGRTRSVSDVPTLAFPIVGNGGPLSSSPPSPSETSLIAYPLTPDSDQRFAGGSSPFV